ncbi:Metallo-dependent phosphatase-like protein [Triangularia setosa]|uniref:Metallo-dependent phosphatase-like protein n=1 Tax=Triangularia setosa TaxID=2587417 RepID=A0AAN6W0I6_9PEZI|nr:Metallo-dependent phosphatase-like protein [Podospora setosa]
MASFLAAMSSLWRTGHLTCRNFHTNTALGVVSVWGSVVSYRLRGDFQPQHFSSTPSLKRFIDIKMAKFQILSDLHLEISPSTRYPEYGYTTFHITPRAPYLALLGDIGLIAHRDSLRQFLLAQLRQFKVVFYVPGNHEPYSSSWEAVSLFLEELSVLVMQRRKEGEKLGEFVPLDRTRYDIKGDEGEEVTVLGCTLHSFVADEYKEVVTRRLNDFYRIRGWSVEDHNRVHDEDKKWLNKQMEDIEQEGTDVGSKRRVVIFTHHSPTVDRRANHARHELVEGWEAVSSAFRTDLSQEKCWTSDRVKLWAFGHTHFNCHFWVDGEKGEGKRVYTNQRGYDRVGGGGLSAGFDMGRVVQI